MSMRPLSAASAHESQRTPANQVGSPQADASGRTSPTKRRVLVALLAAAVVAILVLSPLRLWMLALVTWVQAQGAAAAAIFAAVYFAAALLLVPGSVLTLGAGFLYGVVVGSLLVIPTSIVAALAAFAIARRLGRPWVERRVARDPRFAVLDRAIGRAGFKITLLVRLSPIFPYGLLNYALGVSRVGFRDYAVATAVGMLPGTILYIYLGSLVTSASDLGHHPAGGWLYWVGAAITLVVTVAITVIGRRELRRELAEAPR
jgi:uncharacterized membrane protein YdjX (TVP38/TMEM64 family)